MRETEVRIENFGSLAEKGGRMTLGESRTGIRPFVGYSNILMALAKPTSTGPGSCLQVALDAVQDPLQLVHEVVLPLDENLPPLAAMVQSPMPVTTTGVAAELSGTRWAGG